MICPLCGEPVSPRPHSRPINGNELAHRECMLRSALGGIGHLEDHKHWCLDLQDPDGGRSYRQSALEVDLWVAEHGLP